MLKVYLCCQLKIKSGKSLLKIIRKILILLGYSVTRYPSKSIKDLQSIIQYCKTDLILDAGANTGQFADWIQTFGYRGAIFSFEPMEKEYQILLQNSKKNPKHLIAPKCALGAENGTTSINVSENSVSSSLLQASDYVLSQTKGIEYIKTEEVAIRRLDSFADEEPVKSAKNIFLKIDVQGFEDKVIIGAEGIMNKINGILVEVSLPVIYEGQPMLNDILQLTEKYHFEPYYFIPHTTTDQKHRMLQVDIVFIKKNV